jgi:hypothetical protein
MLREFDAFSGTLVVKSALRLAPLLFVRPGNFGRRNGRSSIWKNASGATP